MSRYAFIITDVDDDGYTQNGEIDAASLTSALAIAIEWTNAAWVNMEVTSIEKVSN